MDTIPEKPLVSIITVVFNGAKTIERTIQSVICQIYKNIEYIIIDGGSTDGTLEIINKNKIHFAKIVSEKDNGIADAMNKGIAISNGSIIGILNADDWFEIDAVEKIVKAAKNNLGTIIHGNMKVYLNTNSYYIEKAPVFPNLKKGMELNHTTVFIPKFLYEKYGIFDIKYQIVFDWELMLRFHLEGIKFVKVDGVLANFSSGGVSTYRPKCVVEEMHQVRKTYKVYDIIDKYYIINKLRLFIFGKAVIKISQGIRLIKYKLTRIK